MDHITSWRNFRRMQMSTFAAAGLIYAGAVIYAWRTLPGPDDLKLQRTVLFPLSFLLLAAGFIYWQVAAVEHGGRYPAGVFSGYAAGIGILVAQILLVRRMERDPEIRALIEVR